MWTCPVCDHKCHGSFCSKCGFDHSSDFEHFPTLQIVPPPAAAISRLRVSYAARNTSSTCVCCGSTVTGNNCGYCNFISVKDPAQRSSAVVLQLAAKHADAIVASLTGFSIVAYRYAWVPEHSRLEWQGEEIVPLGNARDFFPNIVWANKEFGQLRNGTGTELIFDISYQYKDKKKVLHCTIPTVKCDNFWRLGISLDKSLRLKLYLGSGKKFVESAPIALDLT